MTNQKSSSRGWQIQELYGQVPVQKSHVREMQLPVQVHHQAMGETGKKFPQKPPTECTMLEDSLLRDLGDVRIMVLHQ